MSGLPRGAATVFVAQVIANVGFFVGVLVLARTLGPDARGTMAFVTISAMLMARIVAIGVGDATTVRAAGPAHADERPMLLSNLFGWAVVSGTVGAGANVALIVLVDAIRPAGLTDGAVAAIAVGTLGCSLCEAGYAFVAGLARWRSYSTILMFNAWIYAALLVSYDAIATLDLTSAATIWAVNQMTTGLMVTSFAVSGVGFGRVSLAVLRQTIRFGARAWLGTLAAFANFRADQYLMAIISTEAALGIYAVAVNASEVLLYLPAVIGSTLTPAIAAAAPEARRPTTLRTYRTVQLVSLISIAIAAPFAPLIPVLFGEDFADSSRVFLLLLPGTLGFTAITVFKSSLLASGAPGRSTIGIVVALVVGFLLVLLLVPEHGAEGAAIAASSAFLAGGLAGLIAYRMTVPFRLVELVPRPSDLGELVRQARARFGR